MTAPLIGITTDSADPDPLFGMTGYTVESELYAAVVAAGGIPVALPASAETLPAFFNSLSAVVFSGGGYAMPSDWYFAQGSVSPYQSSPRLDYSLNLLNTALERSMPILGICAGMQLIAGAHGALLAPDISLSGQDVDLHWQLGEPAGAVHRVGVKEGTLLARLVGNGELGVNSIHREAVVKCPDQVSVSAVSEDGVIEACEIPAHAFCLGLQWHPEQMIEGRDRHMAVFSGLIEEAARYSPPGPPFNN